MKLKRLVIGTMFAALSCAVIGCSKQGTEESTSAGADASAAETVAGEEKPENYGTVTLGEYKNLEIEVSDSTVTDAEVDEYINNSLSMNPDSTEITGRAAKEGDIVNINYKGLLNGEPFEGGTAEAQDVVIGAGGFIPGFEEGIVGMNIGDEKSIDVTFPEDYHAADLAGKAVVFEIKVNAIKEEKPAELTDAWVETTTAGEIKTVEDYKKTTRENLETSKKLSSEAEAKSLAMEQAIAASTYEVSPEAVEYEFQKIKKQYKEQLEMYGMTMESVAEMNGKTVEEFEADLKISAEKEAQRLLTIDAIFEKEGMKVEDADYKALAELIGQPDKTANDLALEYGQEVIDNAVRDIKVATFIVDNAKVSIRKQETSETAAEKVESSEAK